MPLLEDQALGPAIEVVLEARRCPSLAWWAHHNLLVRDAEPLPEQIGLPPGWQGPQARAWFGVILQADSLGGLWGRTHWLLSVGGHPHLIHLGPPTPTLRRRAALLDALLRARGNAAPAHGLQGRPAVPGDPWPPVQPWQIHPLSLQTLREEVAQLERQLDSPLPPSSHSRPVGRCWDCPACARCRAAA
ncbi:MAG: hypothetical protein BWY56_02628 [Acidobacteria bacterium ADurb.Bin340]|nr:MAG: hypothetical protein BWY56_02628 [Acidobacteria bacterium ADurb.Bin340]